MVRRVTRESHCPALVPPAWDWKPRWEVLFLRGVMADYKKHRKTVRGRYLAIMRGLDELFYYGCEVDRWLGEMILMPYISLQWLDQNRTWIRLVAPPSCGKSQHLKLVEGYEQSYVIDTMSPKSFVSGYRGLGEDASKLPQFDGKVLVISDESTILEMSQKERSEIMSILRKSYDGKFSKNYGNTKETTTHEADFNILVASTPIIDRYFQYLQALGERFVNYRMQTPDRKGISRKAAENQKSNFKARFDVLERKVHRYLRSFPDINFTDIPIPDNMLELMLDAADFVALVRTHINRDVTGTRITTLPQPEAGARLVTQMTQMAVCNAAIKGAKIVDYEHTSRAIYLCLGCLTGMVSFFLNTIWKRHVEMNGSGGSQWFRVMDMIEATSFAHRSIRTLLEDFSVHRVLDVRKRKSQGGRALDYRLNAEMAAMIEDTGLFQYYNAPCGRLFKYVKRKDRFRTGEKNSKKKKKAKKKNKSS